MTAEATTVPRASNGWQLVAPLLVAGVGLGLLVSQLNYSGGRRNGARMMFRERHDTSSPAIPT
jgi:hypothetical protein